MPIMVVLVLGVILSFLISLSLSLSRKNLNQPKPKQSKKKKSDKPHIPPPQPPSKVSSSLLYGYMCSLPARVLLADASVFIMLGPVLILRFCIKLLKS